MGTSLLKFKTQSVEPNNCMSSMYAYLIYKSLSFLSPHDTDEHVFHSRIHISTILRPKQKRTGP